MRLMSNRTPTLPRTARPFAAYAEQLAEAGLRPTRQRLALARLLHAHGHRHVTAEMMHGEALKAGQKMSLATVYNALNQFTAAGLLRTLSLDGTTIFDTNLSPHSHMLDVTQGTLIDLAPGAVRVDATGGLPQGYALEGVDVIVRARPLSASRPRKAPRKT